MQVIRDVNKGFCTRIFIIALFIKQKTKEITSVLNNNEVRYKVYYVKIYESNAIWKISDISV